MNRAPRRRSLPHFEIFDGTAHLVWRLRQDHTPLSGAEREAVREVIIHDQGLQCDIIAGVVMDDHVHALVHPHPGVTSMSLAATWKSVSSHRLCGRSGRVAPLWQRGTYQRWMRSPAQTALCATYIQNNPRRRGPGVVTYPWLLP